MRRRSTQILSILLVLVVVLAAAGCGGKKKTTTTTTTVTQATTTTTAASGTTTSAGGTTSVAGLGALSGDCKQFADLGKSFTNALQGASGDVQKQAQIFKSFADKTPSNVRSDFETIADAYTQVAGAVPTGGGKPNIAKLLALSQKFQDAKFQAALKNVEAWVAGGCKSS